MSDVRAELSALIRKHNLASNEWGPRHAESAADAILARFAVLALPDPTVGAVTATAGSAVWEWDGDLAVKSLNFPSGATVTTSEGLIFPPGHLDMAEHLAAALCAAARHARTLTESQTEPKETTR